MQRKRDIVLLILLGVAVLFGWQYLINQIWPTKPVPPQPKQEAVAAVAGGIAAASNPARRLKHAQGAEIPQPPKEEPKKEAEQPKVVVDDGKDPLELIPLGWDEKKPYYLQILLNTRGGSVQQVIVTDFPAANREGREIIENGKPRPLHLVPGVPGNRDLPMREPNPNPKDDLKPGLVNDPQVRDKLLRADASYVMYHYDKQGDERPLNDLGIRNWNVIERSLDPETDEQKVVFQTRLEEPHNLLITKTFTLKRSEYHVGLKIDIKRLDGKKGPNQFRYQLTGAHGLPIEGEWYTSIYRQAIVGFADERGNTSRFIEDARTIRQTEGSDRQTRTDKLAIKFAAVSIQYFASALAVDDEQEKKNFLEFVRATPMGWPHVGDKPKYDHEFLDDLTVRAITEPLNPDQEIVHKYLLYNGPIKVRLLREMPKGQEVNDALIDRYLDKLHLGIMTDAPMANALGRFANSIYWTDLVIAFTNLIHSLLWLLNQVIPSRGICIIIITILVRGMLFPLSRRQAHNTQVMQAKMAKLTPELKKIQEKYKDDFQQMNHERMRLYREHGVNPFAAMGGCFLLMLQMPVFMGLYYSLQESVFFRLESFLWIPNLAAPDMLLFWGESIPYISDPVDLGSTLYLGPYLNILPIIAVLLMLVQQKKMMPVSDDPQVQQQQKMMKFMMIFMGVFFYKIPAGLSIYFIMSTLWGLTERKLLPKVAKPEEGATAAAPDAPPKPLGWWGRRKALWKQKWQEVLEQAAKQAEHRRADQQKSAPGDRVNGDGAKKKKKKRK